MSGGGGVDFFLTFLLYLGSQKVSGGGRGGGEGEDEEKRKNGIGEEGKVREDCINPPELSEMKVNKKEEEKE